MKFAKMKGLTMPRTLQFAIFAICFAIYGLYVRFTNVGLTETQLFLKMIGLY